MTIGAAGDNPPALRALANRLASVLLGGRPDAEPRRCSWTRASRCDPASKRRKILAIGDLGVRRQPSATAGAAIAHPGTDEFDDSEHNPEPD